MSNNSALVNNKLLFTAGLGLGIAALSGASYVFYKYWKKNVMPQKWKRIGTLQQINLFPIKSCARLQLKEQDEIACDVLGLRLDGFKDRALMILDTNNAMITARAYPKMVLIESKKIAASKLLLCSPQMKNQLELDFGTLSKQAAGNVVPTSIFGTPVNAMLCGEIFDKWFSECLLGKSEGLRLVYYCFPEPVRSINDGQVKEPFIKQEDTGTFGDCTSYMLMNLASVDDLNTRLKNPVDPLQFRGNFYLRMDKPEAYAEDKWGWIKIGEEVVFRNVAPCCRCIFPNINVKTAERDPDGEPLKTLKKYRLFKNYSSPALGIHLGVRQAGNVKLNDVIYVEDF